jgi:large subunit ribosomal protein L4
MSVPTFTKAGAKATTPAKLNKDIFELKVESHDLLKQAYLAYLANGRSNNAVVKTRGLVSGGGRKPWKQKGTGRARFGSSRNPIWRGGGIVFGPTGQENYSRSLNTEAKRLAVRQALSLNKDTIKVIESFEAKDGKVKNAVAVLDKLDAKRNVLVVVENKTAELVRATQNIPYVTLVSATYLNTYDVLNADSIVITKKALEQIDAWLGGKK